MKQNFSAEKDLSELIGLVVGSYSYDELSDYGKGVRDTLNLIVPSLNEDVKQEDIIKEINRIGFKCA